MLYRTYRYSQWDGTQRIFEFDADQLMDLLSEDILNHGDVMQALRDMLRQGLQDRDGQQMPGLRELMEQLKNQRRQQMQQHNMDSVVDDLKERLEEIVQTERDGIKRRLDEAREQVEAQADSQDGEDRAQMEGLLDLLQKRADNNRGKLDDLPESPAGQIKELLEYDFIDPEAQQKFQDLLDALKSQMAQNMGQQMMDQVKGMSEEDMAATREMMRALNQMIKDKLAGQEPDFDGFMQQFGQMFGDNPPKSFDELMEQMQQLSF